MKAVPIEKLVELLMREVSILKDGRVIGKLFGNWMGGASYNEYRSKVRSYLETISVEVPE